MKPLPPIPPPKIRGTATVGKTFTCHCGTKVFVPRPADRVYPFVVDCEMHRRKA